MNVVHCLMVVVDMMVGSVEVRLMMVVDMLFRFLEVGKLVLEWWWMNRKEALVVGWPLEYGILPCF